MGHNIHMIVFIISSGRGAKKSVFVGRKRLDVAIDAAIVYDAANMKAKQAEYQYLASRGYL